MNAGTLAAHLVECGVCHEVKPPAEWCHDSEDGAYAVCAPCLAESRPH